MGIPALPYCHSTLRAKTPRNSAYPIHLEHLGDHIRQRRLERHLLQREAAGRIGVAAATVNNWEQGRTESEFRFLPAIRAFLGYLPETPTKKSLGAALIRHRTQRGLSQSAFARELGVDPGTLGRWDRDERRPVGNWLTRVQEVLLVR